MPGEAICMTTTEDAGVPSITLPALFLKFLRFGALAFGGPVAQIAMIRQALVDDERWISVPRFNRLLAVMQVLPGPEAHELCVHLGIMARGRIGGLLAGLGFMLPGLVLMLGCAWAYATYIAGQPELAGVLLGVQAAVIGIIVRAIYRIGSHILIENSLIAIAVVSALATLVGVPFWVPLAAGGIVHALGLRMIAAALLMAVAALLGWGVTGSGIGVTPNLATTAAIQATTLALFVAGLKGGLLTFGGAYTAIPYVRADTVGRGWISDGAFLDGVAIAGVLPAPLVIFGTFAGFQAGGWAGALALTAGMFLPAFAFSMVFFERLEQLVEAPALHRLLDGIAAAVVGIIATTCAQLTVATLDRAPTTWPIVLLGTAALIGTSRWKSKLATPVLLALGGIGGALLFA